MSFVSTRKVGSIRYVKVWRFVFSFVMSRHARGLNDKVPAAAIRRVTTSRAWRLSRPIIVEG